jgi:hypothetical protein
MMLAPTKNGAKEKDRNYRGMWMAFVLLLSAGMVVLYAASYYNAQDATGDPFSEVLSQLYGVALGAAAMLVISRIDYRFLGKRAVCGSLLALSLASLVLVAIPGVGSMVNGSRGGCDRPGRVPAVGDREIRDGLFLAKSLAGKTATSRVFPHAHSGIGDSGRDVFADHAATEFVHGAPS